MPGLTKKVRNGICSRVITNHMLLCVNALRTQLDANYAGAKLGITRHAIYSNLSNIERKTGWNLFTVTRLTAHGYVWIADETAAPFFAWMAANPQGGKDWPRPPGDQVRRQTHGLMLASRQRTDQDSRRIA